MDEKPATRANDLPQWQDWLSLAIGGCLFVAPWLIYGPETTAPAQWNSWVCGAALVLLTLAAIFKLHEWEEWVDGAIGLWLIVSPWVLGFAELKTVLWTTLICGAIVVAMAAEELWEIHFPPHKPA